MLVMADATAPRVVLQYPRGDAHGEARASLAAQALRAGGLDSAAPVAVIRPSVRPGIGYYFLDDRDAAQEVARRLAGIANPGPVEELPMPSEPPAPGTIEVLLAGR